MQHMNNMGLYEIDKPVNQADIIPWIIADLVKA